MNRAAEKVVHLILRHFSDRKGVHFLKALFFLIVSLSGTMTPAQKGRGDEPLSEDLHKLVSERLRSIEKEASSNEWAGTYFDGDHHATVIRWAPESGFVVTASHHTFSPTWVNYGKVSYEQGRLTLFPELKKGQPNAYGIGSDFVPVLWDKWHLLIPSDQLLQFAYAVHSNSEAAIWEYFIKAGDSEKSRRGLPNLPPEYLKFMKMPAIRARIVSVKSSSDLWTSEVVLDAGRKHNVIEGMQFFFVSRSGVHIRVTVDRIEQARSFARPSMIANSGETNDDEARIRVGWTFSSKMPEYFIQPG